MAHRTTKPDSETGDVVHFEVKKSAAPRDVEHERRLRLSDRDLQVLDLKASVTLSRSALVLDVSVSCTILDLKMDDVMLFRFGLRSPMRNRELYRTTKSLRGMDGRSRRQARNDACLGRIDTYSQTYTTYVWTPPNMFVKEEVQVLGID